MNQLPRSDRHRNRRHARTAVVVVIAAVACALTGCSPLSGNASAGAPGARSKFTLLQMNLCLSGVAGCYGKVSYPAGVDDVVARISVARPDAVTLNEVCGGDIEQIARRTGYHQRFSKVIYYGRPLRCVRPNDRGLFGDAVLTRATIARAQAQPFRAQAGPEQRQWLCVATRTGVVVCTAHLASHEPDEAAANAPQCAELGVLLARRWSTRTVIFGGDVNRVSSCAPHGFWIRTDAGAQQDPGSQQVYGAGALLSPTARVVPARHTDHDALLVSARLAATS